jgi:hypothetical protein
MAKGGIFIADLDGREPLREEAHPYGGHNEERENPHGLYAGTPVSDNPGAV